MANSAALANPVATLVVAPKLVTIRDVVEQLDNDLRTFQQIEGLEGIDRTRVGLIHYGISLAVWEALEATAKPTLNFTLDDLRKLLPGAYRLAPDSTLRETVNYLRRKYCYDIERFAILGVGNYLGIYQRGTKTRETIYRFRLSK